MLTFYFSIVYANENEARNQYTTCRNKHGTRFIGMDYITTVVIVGINLSTGRYAVMKMITYTNWQP